MRIPLLTCLLLATGAGALAEDVPATFRYAKPTATSVEVAGEFNNWKTIPLAKDATGTWTKTVHLKPGTYAYKFVVDGDWILDPSNSVRKLVNDIENSAITVGGAAAPEAGKPSVSFRYTDPKAKTVHVAGEFNRWLDNVDGKVTGKDEWSMQSDGAGNWHLAKELPAGRYQFKYVIDGGARWEKDSTQPAEGDNSVLEVRAGPPAPAAGNASFVFAAPDAKAVAVAGEFNQWNPHANPLQKDSAGLWTTTVNLKPGKHPYKFVVDGVWQTDPAAAEFVDDGHNGKNAVKIINP